MIKNFLFHRVNTVRDPLWDPMHPKLFDTCLKYITKNYITIQLEELLSSPNSIDPTKQYASIVFDDGYKDNLEYAAPILENHGVKASFYVVTNCIDHNIPTWTHILEHQFQFTQKDSLVLDHEFIPSALRSAKFTGIKSRLDYAKILKPFLKTLLHFQRNIALADISLTFDDVKLPRLMMNWDEVRELRSAGHYIGSHTISHCMLGTMQDETEILHELRGSAEIIERELNYFPETISYPVGSYNKTTIELSKKAGYKFGLAVKQNIYDPTKDDIFEIPRIELYNESYLKTYLRMTNILENVKKVIHYRK